MRHLNARGEQGEGKRVVSACLPAEFGELLSVRGSQRLRALGERREARGARSWDSEELDIAMDWDGGRAPYP